jgi:hypothetical protein
MVNHNLDDIWIDSKFNRVWGEKVGDGEMVDFPAYWDLMNDANLLSPCIGGKKEIRSNCIEVDTRTVHDRTATVLEWDSTFDDITVGESKTFNLVSDATYSFSEELELVSHNTCSLGDYTVSIEIDESVPYSMSLSADYTAIQLSNPNYLNGLVLNYNNTGVNRKPVTFYQYNPYLFFYEGVGGFEVDSFRYNSSALTVTSDDTGTTVTNSSGSRRIYWANITGTSTSDTQNDYFNESVTDFDLLNVTGTVEFVLRNSTDDNQFYRKALTGTGHMQFRKANGTVEFYCDGALVDSASVDESLDYQICLYVGNNGSFKFKNFIIGGY